MDLGGARSVLDVGCGPGTVALPLALAHRLETVVALDYSAGMLEQLQGAAAEAGLTNIQTVHRAWEDDWSDVPVCDIAIASRSTSVDDLDAAVAKLQRHARLRVYLSYPVGGQFMDGAIVELLGMDVPRTPDHLLLLGMLHRRGVFPRLDFIQTPSRLAGCKDFQAFAERVAWSAGPFDTAAHNRLKAWFEADPVRAQSGGAPMRWAFVGWRSARAEFGPLAPPRWPVFQCGPDQPSVLGRWIPSAPSGDGRRRVRCRPEPLKYVREKQLLVASKGGARRTMSHADSLCATAGPAATGEPGTAACAGVCWRVRRRQTRAARMVFMATKNPKKPDLPLAPPGVGSDDSVVLERRTQKVKPPQMYQVVLLNDDFTPMEFVVYVIQEFFSKDRETATQIMLKIHLEGKGICGVYSRDVASTKVDQVTQASREAGHPLQCLSEPVE